MKPEEMDRLVEGHIGAEAAGDTAGAVAMYTEDVEHDVVDAPHGPLHGKEAAQGFYEHFTSAVSTEEMVPTRATTARTSAFTSTPGAARCPAPSLACPATGSGSRSGCCTCGSSTTA